MLKCLAVICILGLVSAADWENAQAGKRSQRLNLLSRTVGARMTGTNDPNFQSITPTGNNNQQQFVPIARQNTAGINSITPTGGQVMDNSLTGGQQLTPEQIQQLHSFLTAQQQSQQQPTGQQPMGQQPMGQQPMGQQPMGQQPMGQQPMGQQPMGQQPMGQQPMSQQPMTQQTGQQSVVPPVGRTMTNNNMPQQPQQPQQMFRMDSTGVTGGMNTPTESADQTGRFNQGRMMMPTQQQQQPAGAAQSTPVEPTAASRPSALEQQLLDQQVLTQRLKEQLQQLQQQQRTAQTPTVATKSFVQQPVEQLTQEQNMQRMTTQQQQQQQQQLLDQINQLNQMNQQQGRTVAQQQPAGVQQQQQPTTQQNFGRTNQMMPTQPTMPTQQMMPSQQMMPTQPMMPTQQMMATNTSRMVMAGQQQQQQPRTQGRIGGGDICANAQPGELMPHPLDETQFLVCNELGEITLMDCPNHTVFNPHLKLCDLTSEMPLLCKANPCLNGAKCVEVSPVQFRCECPQGFSGKTCEKFDTCQSSRPCGADGVCLSFALGSPIPHVCLCNGGRSVGLTCDRQIEQNPCTLSGSSTKLMPVAFNRAVFAHCEGARPHFKFCQPPLMFSASKQACEWSI